MPHSKKEDTEDIELSDAPPIETNSDNNDDSAPDDDSDVGKGKKAKKTKASSNGAAKTGGRKKANLKEIFDDDEDEEDEFRMNDEEEAMLFAAEDDIIRSLGPSDPGVMLAFYQRLLPFRLLFQWLNHSSVPSNDFAHREFSFTLHNDAYLRYQSFPSAELFRQALIRLNPTRFEIGPVYTSNPKDRKQLAKNPFRPLHKELVFDIDMNEYDDVRTCCDKATICNKCWSFVTMAIKVLDVALKEDFGFKHVLWVYSGRRGAHAWVCDKRARMMDDHKRRSVAAYLEVIKGGSHTNKKVNLKRPLHPHLTRSFDILKEEFESRILEDQDPWRETKNADKLLKLIPHKELAEGLRRKWESQHNRSSTSKWEDIDALAQTGVFKNLEPKLLKESKQDIILEYMYPRLDAEVSKHLNHLLKSPFCVHPATGRVCVPIDAEKAEEFDPFSVPTVTDLLEEIDLWGKGKAAVKPEGGEGREKQDYEKTSLKPYVDYFKAFVAKLLQEEGKLKGGVVDSMEF